MYVHWRSDNLSDFQKYAPKWIVIVIKLTNSKIGENNIFVHKNVRIFGKYNVSELRLISLERGDFQLSENVKMMIVA